jgi:bacteriorhodopsin
MNRLCDGHVATGLVSHNVNGFPDVFWMCFASNCAYVMSLWFCYRSKFSGEADQGYHDATSSLTAMQPQLMGNIH